MRSALVVLIAASAFGQTSPNEYSKQFDDLWPLRDDPESMKATEATIRDGLKTAPDDYDLLWRAARYRWWVADGADEKLKKQLSKEGWNYAERAQKAKRIGPQAEYYTALNIGAYSQAVGILKALGDGLEGKFNDNLDAALKSDPGFDRYGPHTAKGRYYWELPWPKRDLDKSRTELKLVLAKHPEHLRAWLFLAETELKDGHPEEAKAALDKVLGGASDYDLPEARRIKKWAAPVATQVAAALK